MIATPLAPSPSLWTPVLLSLRLATVTTVLLLLLALPLAWYLARSRGRLRPVVEAFTALPLVLPPTVLGFYLLLLLGPAGPIGGPWEALGGARLVFSFPGLVIGSMLFSLPFAVQPLRDAFAGLGERPLEIAATLGASPWDRFRSVALPVTRPALWTAATLTFAHTIGEFGVVLMLGGAIPGRTEVVSIAIYEAVEQQRYSAAHLLSAGLAVFSFGVLLLVGALRPRHRALPAA